MTIVEVTTEDKCCCSCNHNIRKKVDKNTECFCDIDNHYIGYVACFGQVCEKWKGVNNDNI